MAETGRTGGAAPAGGPPPQELEERWRETIDALGECPRDVDLLLKAGQLSEQLNRRPEAYTYYHKALTLDPSKAFIVPKLKALASGPKQVEEVTKISRRPASFAAALPDVFKYPLRGKGLAILIMGALLLYVARSLMKYGMGMSGITLLGIVTAYIAMFYIDVCHTTVGGDDELPEWPDPLRLHEFGLDVGKFVCALLCSFLPVILIFVFLGASLFGGGDDPEDEVVVERMNPNPLPLPQDPEDDDEPAPAPKAAPAAAPAPPPSATPQMAKTAATILLALVGIGVFGIVGLVYLPMATLANVVMGSPFTCFNFPFVFRSIASTFGTYAVCLACYFGVSIVVGAAEFVVKVTEFFLFTGFVVAFLELYGMTMLMRLLGQFYRMTQARLGWMAD